MHFDRTITALRDSQTISEQEWKIGQTKKHELTGMGDKPEKREPS
jgi:hypothetical protein